MVRPAWPVALIVALVVAFATPARATSVLPARMGMYTPQGSALVMLDSKVVVRVRGPIAEATVSQTFRNDLDRVTEATYIFPLPVDAAVSAMEIETGARTIHAAIEVREQAQQRYETAVAAGVGAALLDQERPDVFTQTVSAIPAKGTVVVTLRFDTVARYQGGRWELVLPMVVAPRFVPGTASGQPTTGTGGAPDTDRAHDASRVTPGGAPGAGGKTEVVLDLGDAVDDVTSPTHDIAKGKSGYAFVDAKSDHDAVIRWRAKLPAAGWVEAGDDGGYAAIVVEARAAQAKHNPLRVMLVLDRAATTRGDADAMKRPLVRAMLTSLDNKDHVAVTGSDKLDWRAPEQALRALDETWNKPGGAFDLTKVLQQVKTDGAALVLVTDGLVADDRGVIAAAGKLGVPVHVIGIGPAPNRGLLTQIAVTTGGTVRFAVVGDDVNALARDVLADAASQPDPLAITWGTLGATDVVPAALPRLGAGQGMLVVAKVKKVQAANARVRGDVFGFVTVPAGKPPDGATTSRGALARRWAKLKLDDLVAAGNAKTISDHALKFGLVSPYTSMVAIGDEVVVKGGVKHSVAITVSVPEGMRWQLVKREVTVTIKTDSTTVENKLADKNKKEAKPKPKHEPAKRPPVERDTRRDTQNAPIAKPAPAPEPRQPDVDRRREATDGAGAGEEDRDGSDDGRKKSLRIDDEEAAPPDMVQGAPPVAKASPGSYDDEEEMIELTSEAAPHRKLRLSVGLGGGFSVVNRDASAAAALSGRIEFGRRRTYAGAELSLWIVDGLAQGSALGTFSYRFLRRLELTTGTGLRVTGDGAGPALNFSLRTHLPVRGLSTFLRYDGALLLRDATIDGQNTGSFGFEASF